MNIILILAVSLFLIANYSKSEKKDFVFETKTIRYIIDENAISKSLNEKYSGRQFLVSSKSPFATISHQGKIYSATKMNRIGEIFRVNFGNSNITIDFQISSNTGFIIFKIIQFNEKNIDEIRFLQLNLGSLPNVGTMLTVLWDNQVSISMMGLSPNVHTRLIGNNMIASVYPEFGMTGEQVAIVASPTNQFNQSVQLLENKFQIPSSRINNKWAKNSNDAKIGYLFSDLTSDNVDEMIRYAKIANFKYILMYSSTWSSSVGSYPINIRNFPKGEESIRLMIKKCNDVGIKVGMHMMTSMVGKSDQLVSPVPDPRLLKDSESILAMDINEKEIEIVASTYLKKIISKESYTGKEIVERDIQIDNEIIHYQSIKGIDSTIFYNCIRGYAGTIAARHKKGTKIFQLAEQHSSYLIDLRTSLKDDLAERIAGIINRCGFDMIYFDGGEVNGINGPDWYWISQQQMEIWKRVKRDILVQGSGITPWTWHIMTRGTCDDFAAVATKSYLTYHKIAVSWQEYKRNFIPAELGWLGILTDTLHHGATLPDEIEYYATRMLAIDSPISIETSLKALKGNERTEEMLKILNKYEYLRLNNKVPERIRQKLLFGEWHITKLKNKNIFQEVVYDKRRIDESKKDFILNKFADQTFKFRLQSVPKFTQVGDKLNIELVNPNLPIHLKHVGKSAPMPGALISKIELGKKIDENSDSSNNLLNNTNIKYFDLSKNRGIAVRIKIDSLCKNNNDSNIVLNIQLESTGKYYRDHYIDLDFVGERIIVLPEPNTDRMLGEFRPSQQNYRFKSAMYEKFNYKEIVSVNLRWMKQPMSKSFKCEVNLIEALYELESKINNPDIIIGNSKLKLPIVLNTGDYAECWGENILQVFNKNGKKLSVLNIENKLMLRSGENEISIINSDPFSAKLTAILFGEKLKN